MGKWESNPFDCWVSVDDVKQKVKIIINRLLDIGFIKVGSWSLLNDKLVCNLGSHHTNSNILNSFNSNGDVKYVGKTIMPLARRMYGYQNPGKSQSTNIRVNEKIKNSLKGEEAVDIFILVDNGLLIFVTVNYNLQWNQSAY